MSVATIIARLVAQGFPESTARKIATGELPMDRASRMARAREQGFDVDTEYFHGTKNAPMIAEEGFDPSRLGAGNDQFGAGFYFTDDPALASSYATDIYGGEGTGRGVFNVFLRSEQPLRVGTGGPSGFGITVDKDQAYELIRRAPNIRSDDGPLSNFIEPSGIDGYTDADIREVASMVEGSDADIIQGDFYPDDAADFLSALTDVTGIDSVIAQSGRSSDPKIATAFSPSQIRSTNAAFDPDMRESANLLASPVPIGVVGGLLATEAATPEGQLNPLLAVPAEVGAALNEAVVGTVDFLVPDTVNAVSELIGSEYRMPRLSDQELVRLYSQGGYMEQGVPRDVVRTATGLLSPL